MYGNTKTLTDMQDYLLHISNIFPFLKPLYFSCHYLNVIVEKDGNAPPLFFQPGKQRIASGQIPIYRLAA